MKSIQFDVDNQDPIASARALLQGLWQMAGLEALYIPAWIDDADLPKNLLCEDPSQLRQADPFAPVFPRNQAPDAYQMLREQPGRRTGIFLRPCEWRTFQTLIERSGKPGEDFLSLSADCTGAMSEQDYIELSAGKPGALTRKVLHFAAQGGILPSQRQSSCQLCEDPFPGDVDLQFELFGVQTEQHLVLSFKDAGTARTAAERMSGASLPTRSVERRKQVLQDLARWRASTFEKRRAKIDADGFTIQVLATHLSSCGTCRNTLEKHCPLIDLEMLSDAGLRDIPAVKHWLDSCSGCGVCEQDCPEAFPLFDVIFSLRNVH